MQRGLVLLMLFLLSGLPAAAQEDILPWGDVGSENSNEVIDLPAMIYGNEDELQNNIVFTIDDCIDEVLTRQMFELLLTYEVTAVFFPLSTEMTTQDPELWREIVSAGFEIGYHTRDHQEGKTVAELERDFTLFQQEVREVLDDPNYEIRLVRPPYGVWDANWQAWAEANDLTTVRWNLVTRYDLTMDYFEAVLRHPDGGGIVLVHPRPTDMWWLEENLDAVVALGTPTGESYHVVSLSAAYAD